MKDTRLRTVRQRVWYFLIILAIVLFACFVWKINQTEKTQLAVRSGQTFEKAKVVEILQDNLQADGSRVGEQKVCVQMKTGVRKGEMLDITSSSGFLFGAPCTVGMKVIVMQSVAGSTTIASVYAQDREWVVYAFAGCPISELDACKADIGSGINTHIQDKVLPNNLDKLIKPQNTMESRSQLGQPQVPENINMEPIQQQDTQPYDANCQFGNCFNRTNAGESKN